ncbi:MAG: sigma-70 family RNA polymerase sigma factor, partial [Pseudomonadota bacterium]
HAAMQAAIAGDRRAYATLLAAIAERVRRHARGRLRRVGAGDEDVEDVVQEVLVAVHTRRDTWEPGRPIGPWVDAIIRYKTVDALRRLGRRRAMTSDTLDVVAATVAAPVPAAHPGGLAEMRRHLAALPGRERGVVAALGLDGMTIAGCAERFGISEGAVRVAFHRGLARLARFADGELPAGTARPTRPGR